ncbi:MAG: hypothetical protein NT150_08440, partial [Bacteroidetes bacterium]|nr:hypothetical protein [Bacteroidota bacterium]
MKSTIKNQSKKLLVLAMALGVFATSCKKENPAAPELPPASSMSMDDSFQNGTNKTEGLASGLCALAMLQWNATIFVNVAVPVASFKEAFNHEAVYDVNTKEWVWSYNIVVAGKTFTAKLQASASGDEINWKMVVSQQGGFSNFVWYTGVSRKDGTAGTWSLNKEVLTPVTYLNIEWSKDASDASAKTKFMYVEPNQLKTDSY